MPVPPAERPGEENAQFLAGDVVLHRRSVLPVGPARATLGVAVEATVGVALIATALGV